MSFNTAHSATTLIRFAKLVIFTAPPGNRAITSSCPPMAGCAGWRCTCQYAFPSSRWPVAGRAAPRTAFALQGAPITIPSPWTRSPSPNGKLIHTNGNANCLRPIYRYPLVVPDKWQGELWLGNNAPYVMAAAPFRRTAAPSSAATAEVWGGCTTPRRSRFQVGCWS